ncbi:hypothetical protein AP064_02595 [Candidatus Liberibacter solanacearum]|uniref:Uncharacterized protein n=1 Tax=Candidatus Liberibacter solanacearum TaxID=556287 RepID=A0A0F4VNI9_9HYPH|nr:hypothetical protein [Candidatus Liberibacter solanacearum]KJZ82227.1 hypothetical protein DJ66_0971 [Candidatus Liberibacter solanacearum]KQC49352.1 hypothetical protein AP064_02595 [Candidatus Liberibacter solanacearum]
MIISETNPCLVSILPEKETNKKNYNPNLDSKDLSNTPLNKISTLESIAKKSLIAAIPIYGTIQAFKEKEFGWGILGITTDILTLIGVGYGIKGAAALMRGSSAAATAAMATGISTAIEGSNALMKSSAVLVESKNPLKSTDMCANTIHIDSLAQNSSKSIGIIIPVVSGNPRLKKIATNYFYDFKLLSPNKAYKELRDASKASEFIVNGEKINIDTPAKMLENLKKIFPNDFEKVQLISCYAHEGIFDAPFTHKLFSIKNPKDYTGVKTYNSYKFDALEDGTINFSATYKGNFLPVDGSPSAHGYGVKVDGILSKQSIPELHFTAITENLNSNLD